MFKHIIKVTLILLIGSTNLISDSNFYLKIDLLNRETSKDSNSQRYIVEVKNKDVTYQYTYGGYPGYEEKSKNYTLTDKELSGIIQEIKDRKINTATKEIRPTKSNGGSTRRVHLSLSLKLDGKITESNISGNTHIFRASGKIKGEIIKNKNYVNNVESLIQDLER